MVPVCARKSETQGIGSVPLPLPLPVSATVTPAPVVGEIEGSVARATGVICESQQARSRRMPYARLSVTASRT